MMKNRLYSGLFLATLATQGCNCDRSEETQPQAESTETTNEVSELKIEDLVVGEGAEAVAGKTVVVHYNGTFLDGKSFDSSIDRGEPFVFQLGAGQVIQGWDQGVQGMKEGGRRILTIPSELAYGSRGAGNVIPPNTPLKFEVNLLEVKE